MNAAGTGCIFCLYEKLLVAAATTKKHNHRVLRINVWHNFERVAIVLFAGHTRNMNERREWKREKEKKKHATQAPLILWLINLTIGSTRKMQSMHTLKCNLYYIWLAFVYCLVANSRSGKQVWAIAEFSVQNFPSYTLQNAYSVFNVQWNARKVHAVRDIETAMACHGLAWLGLAGWMAERIWIWWKEHRKDQSAVDFGAARHCN